MKKQNVMDQIMSRVDAKDFKTGREYDVEMDPKKEAPLRTAGYAVFPEEEKLAAIRLQLQTGVDPEVAENLRAQIDTIQQEAAAERAKRRTVTFITSTSAIDRYSSRIRTEGIDVSNFERCPVIGFGHDLYGSFFGPPQMENVVGRSVAIRKGIAQMEQDIEFASESVNPKGERCFQMVTNRFLHAASIGFIPKQIVVEVEDERQVPVITKCELLETSIVPIPANPEALALVRAMAQADFMTNRGAYPWIREQILPELMDALETGKADYGDRFRALLKDFATRTPAPAPAADPAGPDWRRIVEEAVRGFNRELETLGKFRRALRS